MRDGKQKLTLDQPVTYQIKVPGELDENWVDLVENTQVLVEHGEDGQAVSVLTGMFDQAALHGLLRLLYSRGVPLISVLWIDWDET